MIFVVASPITGRSFGLIFYPLAPRGSISLVLKYLYKSSLFSEMDQLRSEIHRLGRSCKLLKKIVVKDWTVLFCFFMGSAALTPRFATFAPRSSILTSLYAQSGDTSTNIPY